MQVEILLESNFFSKLVEIFPRRSAWRSKQLNSEGLRLLYFRVRELLKTKNSLWHWVTLFYNKFILKYRKHRRSTKCFVCVQCIYNTCMSNVFKKRVCPVYLQHVCVQCIYNTCVSSVFTTLVCPVYLQHVCVQCIYNTQHIWTIYVVIFGRNHYERVMHYYMD